MDYPMRKANREVTDPAELDEILRSATVMRLGLCVDDVPYVVPLNFGYEPGRIYFHSAREGRKLDMIARNEKVCFEAEGGYDLISADKPCDYWTRFRSVIGWGRARIVTDPDERLHGFKVLMRHVAGRECTDQDFPAKHADLAHIVAIDIERMTGKKHKWDQS